MFFLSSLMPTSLWIMLLRLCSLILSFWTSCFVIFYRLKLTMGNSNRVERIMGIANELDFASTTSAMVDFFFLRQIDIFY